MSRVGVGGNGGVLPGSCIPIVGGKQEKRRGGYETWDGGDGQRETVAERENEQIVEGERS